MQQDPVCRIWIPEDEESFPCEYLGERYQFCSFSCLEKFLRDPLRYWHRAQLAACRMNTKIDLNQHK